MATSVKTVEETKTMDKASTYLTPGKGTLVVYLVAPILGKYLLRYQQIWLNDKNGKPKPVQSFVGEEGITTDNDPASVFANNPDNKQYVKNPKIQTSYRMPVAVETGGKFELRVLNIKKQQLAEAITGLVEHNPALGGAMLDNEQCVGTKLAIIGKPNGKTFNNHEVIDFTVNILPQTVKPDLTEVIDALNGIDLEDGLGGKTREEVVARINECGFAFDFKF